MWPFKSKASCPKIRNVLVIGCEGHIQRLVQVNLERQCCDVRIAESMLDAMEIVRVWNPQFIVADGMRMGLDKQQIAELLQVANPDVEDRIIYVLGK